jgi:hypothetical protein
MENLSKREYFAAKAMQGLLSNPDWMKEHDQKKYLRQDEIVTEVAIRMGDAMIQALKKPVVTNNDTDADLATAITALQRIAYPIRYLQEEAEKEGAKLDGRMANELAQDAHFYQNIALSTLAEISFLK